MLGRVADNIFWLSRYIERVSNTARFIEASCYLNLDFKINYEEQWIPLIEISGNIKEFKNNYKASTRDEVLHWLLYNEDYSNSLRSCLIKSRDLAASLREYLSIEIFQEINNLLSIVPKKHFNQVPSYHYIFDICEGVKRINMLISGIMSKNMERGIGYNFWALGEFLERSDNTSRLLNVNYFYLLPDVENIGTSVEDLQWSAILQSIDARESYYRRFSIIEAKNIIEMIINDERFPRSIYFCLSSAKRSVFEITRNDLTSPYLKLNLLCNELKNTSSEKIIESGLHEFIDNLQVKINDINLDIYQTFCDPRHY